MPYVYNLHKKLNLGCDGWIIYFPVLCQMDNDFNFLVQRTLWRLDTHIVIKDIWRCYRNACRSAYKYSIIKQDGAAEIEHLIVCIRVDTCDH